MVKIVPVAIYQTKDTIKLIDRPHFNQTMYETQDYLIRMLSLDVTDEFLQAASDMTKEELFMVLNDELDKNPETVYLT